MSVAHIIYVDAEAINPTAVAAVGEVVTEYGPGVEDHFMVFVNQDGTCCLSPWLQGASRISSMLRLTGFNPVARLANATTFSSMIHYPEELKGEPLFEIEEPLTKGKLSHNIFQRATPPLHLSRKLTSYLGIA